jgi:hypothetical protein
MTDTRVCVDISRSALVTTTGVANIAREESRTNSLCDVVLSLAGEIEREWCRTAYREEAFAGICEQALTRTAIHRLFNLDDLLRQCMAAQLLTPQIDPSAQFGQPPVTLFRCERFYVALLFWDDSTTSIHEHGFSGAFSVLSGSSLHVSYAFEPTLRVNGRVLVGKILRGAASVLERGAVREIAAGGPGAHALFHLDRPSATLVVRTYAEPRAQPQLTYHWPCYAIDPFYENHSLARKCQLLRLTYRTDQDLFGSLASDLLESVDFESAVRVLLDLTQSDVDIASASKLALIASRAHPVLGVGLPELVEASGRERQLLALRRRIADPDRRLLLAFLLNRLSRDDIRALVADKFASCEPADLVAAWLASLLEECEHGAGSPLVRQAIRHLFEGQSVAEASRRLVADDGRIAAPAELDAAMALLDRLAEAPLLSTILHPA